MRAIILQSRSSFRVAAERYFGYISVCCCIFCGMVALSAPDLSVRAMLAAVVAAIEEGKPYEFDQRLLLSNGEVRHIYTMGEPLYDDQGLVVKLVSIMLDVTDQQRARERIKSLFDSLQKSNMELPVYESISRRCPELISTRAP